METSFQLTHTQMIQRFLTFWILSKTRHRAITCTSRAIKFEVILRKVLLSALLLSVLKKL